MKSGMGSHESSRMGTDEWLTPPEIIGTLGPFDLDPCAATNRPWDTALIHYTKADNGLNQDWFGRVWLNPPYGRETGIWLARLAGHGNGIALIFARTETAMFFDHVWSKAKAILFIKGRLIFYNNEGIKASMNAGAPSCLVAYDDYSAGTLLTSGIEGRFVWL